MTAQNRNRIEKTILLFIVAVTLWNFVEHFIIVPFRHYGVDYGKHWLAANAILSGETPYQGEELYLGFNYPLLTGFLFLYLRAFPREGSEFVWEIGNVLFSLGGLAFLAFALWPKHQSEEQRVVENGLEFEFKRFLIKYWPYTTALIISCFQPLHRVMIAANIDPFNFFLASGLTACFLKQKDKVAGGFLTFLTLVKIAPLLLWVPVAACRRWRLLLTYVICLIIYLMFLLISGYWRWEIFLYQDTLPAIPFYWKEISLSIHKMAAILFWPSALEDAHLYKRLVLGINIAIALPYLAICAYWSLRKQKGNALLMLSFGMTMVLIFTPLLEINHFVWAVPAMFLQLREWIMERLSVGLFAALAIFWGGVMAMETLGQLTTILKLPVHHITLQVICMIGLAIVSGIAAFRGKGEETENSNDFV